MLVISRIFHGFIPDFPRVCSLRKKKRFFSGFFSASDIRTKKINPILIFLQK